MNAPESEPCRAMGLGWLRLDGGRYLLHARWTDAVAVVDADDLGRVRRCRGFRTLGVHTRELCRDPRLEPGSPLDVRAALARLAEAGFLLPRSAVLAAARATPDPPPPRVDAVAVVTCDRPEAVQRCVAGVLDNLREHGRDARVVVADDGTAREEVVGRLRRMAGTRGARVAYIGREEKARLAEALVRSGVDADAVSFALQGEPGIRLSPGRNRNAVLLETIGTLAVGLDDDTVCDLALPEGADVEALAFSSRTDPTEFRFFPDRAGAEGAVRRVRADLLGVHERLLGRPLLARAAAVAPERLDLDAVNDDLLRWMKEGTGRIRITQTGLFGDAGMGVPTWLLTLDGPSRERLVASEAAYRTARRTREIVRAVPRPTVSNGPFFMTYSAGFDHRELLPPFVPVLRNEDGAFVASLRRTCEADAVGHLPWLVRHDPPEPRAFAEDAIWSRAGTVGFSNFLLAAIAAARVPARLDAAGRLRALGLQLQELAAAPPDEFRRTTRQWVWEQAARWMGLLEERLREHPEGPAYWAEDAQRALADLRARLPAPEFPVPADLLPGRTPDEALDAGRRLLARTGRLFAHWPSIREAAADLRRAERGAAVPL